MSWVRGSRLPLWFLEFRQGSAPETILQDFPAIASLENVYGTITDYLANPPKVEEYLKAQNRSGKNSGNRPIHCQQALPHASKAFAGNRRISNPLLDDPIEDRLDLCRESAPSPPGGQFHIPCAMTSTSESTAKFCASNAFACIIRATRFWCAGSRTFAISDGVITGNPRSAPTRPRSTSSRRYHRTL